MRYLWIEDFNDGTITEKDLEETLKSFFYLNDDRVIIKKDLLSAINFLENKEEYNIHKIDAFLIDIRFPERYKNSEEDVYQKYFRDIITSDFFEQNIEDASGILFYFFLVFKYHVSQQKIAFISANISSDNDKIRKVYDIIEIIAKHKYSNEKMSFDDKVDYLSLENDLRRILNLSREEQKWKTFIVEEDDDDNDDATMIIDENEDPYRIILTEEVDINKLLEDIRILPVENPNKFNKQSTTETNNAFSNKDGSKSQTKYNYLKEQFDKVGFSMPSAFEKPKFGQKGQRYSFLEWENNICKNDYNVIRSAVLEMCLLLQKNLRTEFYKDFLEILVCEEGELDTYNDSFYRDYLKRIQNLFPLENSVCLSDLAFQIVKEITSIWENSAIPIINGEIKSYSKRKGSREQKRVKGKLIDYYLHEDNCFYANHAVMKLSRNWSGHQGIKNLHIRDVGFIFLVGMRGLFDISKWEGEDKKDYLEYEQKILNLFEELIDSENIEDSLQYFCQLNNETEKTLSKSSNSIYERISGLGHTKSKIRKEVSMDDLYMLYYHAIKSKKLDDVEYQKILNSISGHTWNDWKDRYNKRFENYIKLN